VGLSKLVPVRGLPALAELLANLERAGLPSSLIMVDNQLVSPKIPPPSTWRDVRLKTPAGTVTLKRDPSGVTVTIFGNADPALVAAQDTIVKLLS
jgi:hypothetical protein